MPMGMSLPSINSAASRTYRAASQANNEMQRTKHGPAGASPLISVFARPSLTGSGPRLMARDCRVG
jgi:hypothetical protein